MSSTIINKNNNQAPSIHQLYDVQDELNKINHRKEVEQELVNTITLILHCIDIHSTDPLYTSTTNTPSTNIFHNEKYQEIHKNILHEIQTKKIQNIEDFMDELFNQIFHSPRIPILFQQNPQYKTLETYIEPLYQLYSFLP